MPLLVRRRATAGGRQPPSPVGTQRGYQPAEILSTLLTARRDLELPDGHWASQWEYSE
jgi:hypothetical protein